MTISLPRFSGEGYAARLQRRGFSVVGVGGGNIYAPASYVLARPASGAVVKVGTLPGGDPWPLYAAWSHRTGNAFGPRVRRLKWHGRGFSRFYVATMDRLYGHPFLFNAEEDDSPMQQAAAETARRLSVALQRWGEALPRYGFTRFMVGPSEGIAPLTKLLAKETKRAGLPEFGRYVRALHHRFPEWMVDASQANFMFAAGGQLVWTDALVRSDLLEAGEPAH